MAQGLRIRGFLTHPLNLHFRPCWILPQLGFLGIMETAASNWGRSCGASIGGDA